MQVVMVRSLYSYVRVLPAYRVYRNCREQRACHFNIAYRLSSSLQRRPHPPGRPPQNMERFALAPIETLSGHLTIAVEYQSQQLLQAMHAAAQPVSIPQHVIPDYINRDSARRPPLLLLPHALLALLARSGQC